MELLRPLLRKRTSSKIEGEDPIQGIYNTLQRPENARTTIEVHKLYLALKEIPLFKKLSEDRSLDVILNLCKRFTYDFCEAG
jgi:hypothetical protein